MAIATGDSGQGITLKVRFSRGLRPMKPQDALAPELEQALEVAWQAYEDARKAPRTRPAGPGFADPAYATSLSRVCSEYGRHIHPCRIGRLLEIAFRCRSGNSRMSAKTTLWMSNGP